MCLFLLVVIHNGDGHNEETNVGLEGEKDWKIKGTCLTATAQGSLPWLTSIMTMTGAMKAQLK